MANFVKGNYCWQTSSEETDMPDGSTFDRYMNMNLLRVSNTSSAASTYAHQQGRLKALNMHIVKNTSLTETTARFTRRVWNSGTNSWNNQSDITLITIPAGESGYFCSSLSEADTTCAWLKKDIVGLRFNRVGPGLTGDVTGITTGICLELTEEERLDTSGTNR